MITKQSLLKQISENNKKREMTLVIAKDGKSTTVMFELFFSNAFFVPTSEFVICDMKFNHILIEEECCFTIDEFVNLLNRFSELTII